MKIKMFSYHITYSDKYKIYDLVIEEDGVFFCNYHVTCKKELMKLINNKHYNYEEDRYKSYEIQTDKH